MKKYFEVIIWAVFFLAVAIYAASVIAYGKPVAPPPPKKQDQFQYPDLNYESNWGQMKINRNTGEIIIREHPLWDGEAQFVSPTKVYVLWYWKQTGRPAPGIYDLQKDGTLRGNWGWAGDVEVDEMEWTIKGQVMLDHIYPVK